jgi:hypothetical protein
MSLTGPKNKQLKAQFNNLCTAAVVCEMRNIVISAGERKENLIDVGEDGIYFQTDPGKSITFGGYNIKGPIHHENPFIINRFLPGILQTPSAIPNFDYAKQAINVATIASSLGSIL